MLDGFGGRVPPRRVDGETRKVNRWGKFDGQPRKCKQPGKHQRAADHADGDGAVKKRWVQDAYLFYETKGEVSGLLAERVALIIAVQVRKRNLVK